MINVQVRSELVDEPVLESGGAVTVGLRGLRVVVTDEAKLTGAIESIEELMRIARVGDTVLIEGQIVMNSVISATRLELLPQEANSAVLSMPPRLFGAMGR